MSLVSQQSAGLILRSLGSGSSPPAVVLTLSFLGAAFALYSFRHRRSNLQLSRCKSSCNSHFLPLRSPPPGSTRA
jgi:hypothetical protein